MTMVVPDIEVLDEKILDGDVTCELPRMDHEPVPCSIEATHIFTACWSEGEVPVCQKFSIALKMAKAQNYHCMTCHTSCFNVRPI